MRVLMVGCGAVGQVFGLFLQKGGVELGFYARPESADRLKQGLGEGGLDLYQISHVHRTDPLLQRLTNFQVVTNIAESQKFEPDQIWFSTPSTVYYTNWFGNFLREVPSTRVVCFAPEGGRREFYPENVEEDRLVFGGITFITWQGNLDGGGGRAGGVNFWLPPFTQIPLMGTKKGSREVAELLNRGGMPTALKNKDFQAMQAATTALLSAFTAGLELAGWSLKAFRRSPELKYAALAAREGIFSQLPRIGIFTRVILAIFTSTAVFSIATLILPRLTPFDLKKYLKFHYLKTREQTINILDVFKMDGENRGLPMENVRILLQRLLDSE